MSQPYTAAIIVGAIFGGLAVLIFGYKAYRKIWNWRHREKLLPPIREPPTAYHGGTVMTVTVDEPSYPSVRDVSSRNSYLRSASPHTPGWSPKDGLVSSSASEMPSPSVHALDAGMPSTPSEVYDPHYRGVSTISSSSSTMTLKRSYLKSSSASQLSYMSGSSRRESYLPHSPLNRDSIQIVAPQPLGFGGTMATAADQRTLAFSKDSSIGNLEDFSSGLVWVNSGDRTDQRARSSVRSQAAGQDRRRYLMEGPFSARDSDTRSMQSSGPALPSSQSSSQNRSGGSSPTPGPSTSSQGSDAAHQPDPNLNAIDPKTLDAKHSPLQRLQADGHPQLPADDTSLHSDFEESPILSPFAPKINLSGPPTSVPVTVSGAT